MFGVLMLFMVVCWFVVFGLPLLVVCRVLVGCFYLLCWFGIVAFLICLGDWLGLCRLVALLSSGLVYCLLFGVCTVIVP